MILLGCRVERAVNLLISKSELNREAMNLAQAGIREVSRESIVVAGARRRVQVRALLYLMVPPHGRIHSITHPHRSKHLVRPVLRRHILAVEPAVGGRIRHQAPHGVVALVHEVHVRLPQLVLVAAPVVQHRTGVRVDVHEPLHLLVLVHHPLDALRLGLGKRCCSVVRLVRRVLRRDVRSDSGREVLEEVKKEIEVAVEVDSHRFGVSSRRRRVAVLAPAAARGLVIRHTVGVAQRREDDASRERTLDVAIRVCSTSVRQPLAVLVGVQQVGDEVDDVVRSAALAGVDRGVEVHAIRIGAVARAADLCAEDGGILVSLERRLEVLDVVLVDQSADGALDLVDVQESCEVGASGLCAKSAGDLVPAVEAVASPDGYAGVVVDLATGDLAAGCLVREEAGLAEKGEGEESADRSLHCEGPTIERMILGRPGWDLGSKGVANSTKTGDARYIACLPSLLICPAPPGSYPGLAQLHDDVDRQARWPGLSLPALWLATSPTLVSMDSRTIGCGVRGQLTR